MGKTIETKYGGYVDRRNKMEKEIEFIKVMKEHKFSRKRMRKAFIEKFGEEEGLNTFDNYWISAHAKPVPEVKEVKVEKEFYEIWSVLCQFGIVNCDCNMCYERFKKAMKQEKPNVSY